MNKNRDFFGVPQGPFMGPVPMQNTQIFSHVNKKKSQLENKFK